MMMAIIVPRMMFIESGMLHIFDHISQLMVTRVLMIVIMVVTMIMMMIAIMIMAKV